MKRVPAGVGLPASSSAPAAAVRPEENPEPIPVLIPTVESRRDWNAIPPVLEQAFEEWARFRADVLEGIAEQRCGGRG